MRIAVLMSTYNGHSYLHQQLKSLTEQTVADEMTIYIRDDGSCDDTFEIIERWKSKARIVLYKGRNVGPALSFWRLLTKPEIQADYYAFCDQDDVWDIDKLEKAIKKLNIETPLYACNCRIINKNNDIVLGKRVLEAPVINIQRLFISGCTQGCSMVFTNELRKYLVTSCIKCIPMHDVILMLYALQLGKIYWDSESHFSYRVHSNNVVAKYNKTTLQKLKTTYWNWKNSEKNSMSDVAKEFLQNKRNLSDSDLNFLNALVSYRNSIHCKYTLLTNKNLCYVGNKARYSFILRVILNFL